jgi:peptide/nickel transport system substrate-binding protein
MKKKYTLMLCFCLVTCFLFGQASQNNKVLKVGVESDIDMLSPWESGFAVTSKIFWNVLETLVTFEEQSNTIKPNLAISWEASDKNRIWTFKLREGVKFHDGSSLTADDVVASATLFSELKAKAEKIDPLTVRFTLPEPHSGFLNRLVDIMYGIASARNIDEYKSLEKVGRPEEFIPIGTGPFKFSHYEKGKEIVLESFSDYWQGAPKIDKLVYQIIPDNESRLIALERGEIDLIDVIYPADLPRVMKNSALKVESLFGLNVCFIAINTTRKPLDNIKIRQALNMAIDKTRLVRLFYFGSYGVPTNRVLSPAFWRYNILSNPGIYQVAEAKKILAEEGYENGFSLELLCIPRARPYLPDPRGVAEEIKRQLAAIAVDISINMPATYPEYDLIAKEGNYDLSLAGWIDVTGDPDYTLASLLSSKASIYNESHWSNELFDKKLQQARELAHNNIEGRIRLYNEAEKIFQDEAPWIPLAHTKILIIHNQKVKNIIFYPSSMISYHKAILPD